MWEHNSIHGYLLLLLLKIIIIIIFLKKKQETQYELVLLQDNLDDSAN